MSSFSYINSPLDQFLINNILKITILDNLINLALTNMVFYLVTGFLIIFVLNILINEYKDILFNS